MAKFYVTTAIDYVNAKPHIGHAYEKILADVLARWHRIKGDDVFFLTGTDENAQKNVQAAKEKKIAVKRFVDTNSKLFLELCKKLNITYDDFIRTTEERHVKVAQKIFKQIQNTGDIYKGKYAGWYCQGCEAFLTESELVHGKCPEHDRKPEWIEEEDYFFKMSKYEKNVLSLLETGKVAIFPLTKRNEIVSRIKQEGLKDLSVSRYKADWGVDVPSDSEHKIYVWLDALINYISALGYPSGSKYKKYWPADIHIIGKGINWFHSVIWISILLSAKIPLPKTIFVHGYLTINGKKMSKSLGNVIDPLEIVNIYGSDALRYYFMRDVPFGEDGDFSEALLKERINNELANELGNLVSRILTLAEKNFDGRIGKGVIDKKLSSTLKLNFISKHFDALDMGKALHEIMSFVKECNKHINNEKLWEKKGKDLQNHLYSLLESIRIISILLSAYIPETSEKINSQLGVKSGKLKDCTFGVIKTYIIKKKEILFKKL